MVKKKAHNIFISHHHNDIEEVTKLKELLKSHGHDIRDRSIDEKDKNKAIDPEYIKSIIRPRIDWAGTMIVLIGSETHSRKWVNWEIDYAHKNDKRIVGIFIRGAKESEVPEKHNDYGDALVGWNDDNIMSAIKGELNVWLTPNGQERDPIVDPIRSNC